MDLELGRDVATGFSNPDLMAYAESFGARGYRSIPLLTCCPSSPKPWLLTQSR
jgi:hypothetical protein